jgi:hypothetical protein
MLFIVAWLSRLKYTFIVRMLCLTKLLFSVIFRGAGFKGGQMGQSAALYCRVSTADQTCARQERDLRVFAKKAGYKVARVCKETASGTKDERADRKKVLALAQARNIDTILRNKYARVPNSR